MVRNANVGNRNRTTKVIVADNRKKRMAGFRMVRMNDKPRWGSIPSHLQGPMRYTVRLLPKRGQVAEIIVDFAS